MKQKQRNGRTAQVKNRKKGKSMSNVVDALKGDDEKICKNGKGNVLKAQQAPEKGMAKEENVEKAMGVVSAAEGLESEKEKSKKRLQKIADIRVDKVVVNNLFDVEKEIKMLRTM